MVLSKKQMKEIPDNIEETRKIARAKYHDKRKICRGCSAFVGSGLPLKTKHGMPFNANF